MGITIKQRERRKGYLGASDIPVALGFGRLDESGMPYKSQRALWAEKTQEMEQDSEPDFGLPAALGTGLENTILELACQEHGVEIRRNVFRVHPVHKMLACHLDAQWQSDKGIAYEAKWTSQRGRYGDPGSDQVPDEVAVQCLSQMGIAGLERVFVPVLFGGRFPQFEIFVIERDDKVVAQIIDSAAAWWEKHVIGGEQPPEGGARDIEVFKRLKRVPDAMAQIPLEPFEAYYDIKQQKADIDKQYKAAQGEVVALIGTNSGAFVGDGPDSHPFMFTYKQQKGADRVDLKGLRAKHPEIYSEFATENRYPVARVSKNPNHQGDK